MAIDHALMAAVAAGAPPAFRLYRWAPPTLSFGRNQPARGLYDQAAAADRGIDFVRRPTGGQAVLHDDELTYAVVAPVAVLGKPRVAYRRINRALVAALRTLGLDAELSAGAEGSGKWSDACFRRPARGEVVVRSRKLVGSAQRTQSGTILQHGSILLGGSQAVAEELLVRTGGGGDLAAEGDPGTSGPDPGSAVRGPGWTTVEAELGDRPAWDAWADALTEAFDAVFGTGLAPSEMLAGEAVAARELRGRFASAEWTWRR